jgi:hypothetical protein
MSLPSLGIPSENSVVHKMELQQVDSFIMQSSPNPSANIHVEKAVQTDPILMSDIKKNAFKVSKEKSLIAYRVEQQQR